MSVRMAWNPQLPLQFGQPAEPGIFDEMAAYLPLTRKAKQLEFHAMQDFLAFKPGR